MANTYTLIGSNTVGAGGASSVTFSSIPQTYTDLIVQISARTSVTSDSDPMFIRFNGSTSSYNTHTLFADGTSVSFSTTPAGITTAIWCGAAAGATATANTFASANYYIPNYTSSSYKSVSSEGVNENNAATDNYLTLTTGSWSSTAAITSITLQCNNQPFVQYSSFYLYGIKNS
jgi:hypothetical protein